MILRAGSRSPRSDPPLSLSGTCTYQVQPSTAPIRALTCFNTDKPGKASVDRGLVVERMPAWCPAERTTTVHNVVPVPTPASPTSSPAPPPRRRPGAGTLLTLVNGVLAGIGGVYASTHSILITVVAGVMAIALAVAVLIFQR